MASSAWSHLFQSPNVVRELLFALLGSSTGLSSLCLCRKWGWMDGRTVWAAAQVREPLAAISCCTGRCMCALARLKKGNSVKEHMCAYDSNGMGSSPLEFGAFRPWKFVTLISCWSRAGPEMFQVKHCSSECSLFIAKWNSKQISGWLLGSKYPRTFKDKIW